MSDLKSTASSKLNKVYADYYNGGADAEITLNANLQAFQTLQLWPRVLRGAFDDDLNICLPGEANIEYPIIAAPTAFHKLAHKDGEVATAKAIGRSNSLMIVSMASTTSTETIVKAAKSENPQTHIWQQLYIQPDKEFTLYFIQKMETAGCSAFVITVDSPVFGRKPRDIRNNFNSLPKGIICENMKDSFGKIRNIQFDSSLNWQDIAWLQNHTTLPIILKGILHPADITLAIEHGVQAVIVSNHGGRQLDGVPPTITLLPELARAAKQQIPLILDGGIRSGSDILKALAMGASCVTVGRPLIWGLAINGQQGVYEVLQQLQQELLSAIKLCGCCNRKDINTALIFNNKQG